MNKLMPLKAVYSYYFPEVAQIMHKTYKVSDEMYKVTGSNLAVEQSINDALKLNKPLALRATPEGWVDLDRIHEPIIDRVIEAYAPLVNGLDVFEHHYPTAGTSEGIFHFMADLKTKGIPLIYLLKGEYEGYREYARMLGIQVREIEDFDEARGLKEPGQWFISNPSARDGNIIDNTQIKALADAGHSIALDLAYVGATKPYQFDVSHSNINAVFLSFSKPYGVFRYRIGFSFFRIPIENLYGTRWFKDIERLLTAVKLVDALPPGELYKKYLKYQSDAVVAINNQFHLEAIPSDVLLLATAQKAGMTFADYKRGDLYRFCLTPYFEEIAAKHS